MEKQYKNIETFNIMQYVKMETSYGVIDKAETEMTFTIAVNNNGEMGYFELYDIATGGERFYGSGGLWFNGNNLVDYDGVFSLSKVVIDKLNEWGYDTTEIE